MFKKIFKCFKNYASYKYQQGLWCFMHIICSVYNLKNTLYLNCRFSLSCLYGSFKKLVDTCRHSVPVTSHSSASSVRLRLLKLPEGHGEWLRAPFLWVLLSRRVYYQKGVAPVDLIHESEHQACTDTHVFHLGNTLCCTCNQNNLLGSVFLHYYCRNRSHPTF